MAEEALGASAPSDETLDGTSTAASKTLQMSPTSAPVTQLATDERTAEHGLDFVVGPNAGATAAARAAESVTGEVIAERYTLRDRLGEGGMGAVFRADQTEPVKRQVALKLIKIGMDSRAVLARFDAERQALALMDHPNIARVYDGGTTAAGQPFFVMELVHGEPITAYCDRHRLSVCGQARVIRRRLPGRAARAPEGNHPPRLEAIEHPGHRGRRPADAQGHRLRRRQGNRDPAHQPDLARRRDRRHARVHVA